MNEQVKLLLDDVKQHYTMPVDVVIDGPASGVLTHTQSAQKLLANGHLELKVADTTNVDYTLSHELLHMKLVTAGFSPLQYRLATGDPDVDQQFFAVGTSLYDSVMHVQIRAEQAKMGLLTGETMKQLGAGVTASLPDDPRPDQLVYCIMTLLDALVMFEGGSKPQLKYWQANFPDALPLAQELYATITSKSTATPFDFRRMVVRIWRQFDQILQKHGFQETANAEFATLPPILSERQLRLNLNQTYEILHSEMTDRATKKRAYVAMGKGDQQNAFVLPLADLSSEGFQQLYQTPLKTVLLQYQVDYAIRD
ncbi:MULTISPECIES: hypothetical protein [unclassified Lacticaseibacillus]|uniref:hypothetical protein n=1 Tax=unclassified Lacticaseibacillus TaxID=2759744 RepID=UPI0019424122|nr:MULTISPECIES: hypothetical protein [unclassified Lacticaseibacillus]